MKLLALTKRTYLLIVTLSYLINKDFTNSDILMLTIISFQQQQELSWIIHWNLNKGKDQPRLCSIHTTITLSCSIHPELPKLSKTTAHPFLSWAAELLNQNTMVSWATFNLFAPCSVSYGLQTEYIISTSKSSMNYFSMRRRVLLEFGIPGTHAVFVSRAKR